jgi:hypothetical protein
MPFTLVETRIKPALTVKKTYVRILLITVLSSGCASNQAARSGNENTARTSPSRGFMFQSDIWHDTGDVHINVHVPESMVGQTITYYLNNHPVCIGTNQTFMVSLPPHWKNKIGVKMAGTKPVEQSVKVAGYGSSQILDFTLAKQ